MEKDDQIRKYFSIDDNPVTLSPQKETKAKITFKPTQQVEFVNLPIFICNVVDAAKPDVVINSFQLSFSAKVFLSRFEICPAKDMYFGDLPISTTRTQTIELKNVGKFPFNYTIISHKMWLGQLAKKSRSKIQLDGKKGKSKKGKGIGSSKSSNGSKNSKSGSNKIDKTKKPEKSSQVDKDRGSKGKGSKESKKDKGK
ncbi:unnamed protein product [Acanthoscelides obtectus]|uniref:Hydrocephalus-inducing protein n=1 Tax=Acanthoscelides obtectus TaxID=200917 RepID=A0A9P0QJ47_ACAOB|nr:unnamed protein product [Acanthoscelides obtectus]CAK1685394.1 hypothetical protein AOBTE_LOCUS35362 [Acanthoscelides obtectus]